MPCLLLRFDIFFFHLILKVTYICFYICFYTCVKTCWHLEKFSEVRLRESVYIRHSVGPEKSRTEWNNTLRRLHSLSKIVAEQLMGFQREKTESAAQLALNRNKHWMSLGPVCEGRRGFVCFRFSLCLFWTFFSLTKSENHFFNFNANQSKDKLKVRLTLSPQLHSAITSVSLFCLPGGHGLWRAPPRSLPVPQRHTEVCGQRGISGKRPKTHSTSDDLTRCAR